MGPIIEADAIESRRKPPQARNPESPDDRPRALTAAPGARAIDSPGIGFPASRLRSIRR